MAVKKSGRQQSKRIAPKVVTPKAPSPFTTAQTGYSYAAPSPPIVPVNSGLGGPGGGSPFTTAQAGNRGYAANATSGGQATNIGTARARTDFGRSIPFEELYDVWKDPEVLATLFAQHTGLPKYGGGYADLLDDSAKAEILYLLLNNNAKGFESFGNAGPVDWYGKYAANMFTPGGRGVGPQDILGAMFGAKEGTPLFQALYGGAPGSPGGPQTAEEQTANWLQTLGAGLQGTMPDAIFNSQMAAYDQAARDFKTYRTMHPTGPRTFGEYLQTVGLGA